jgi:cupin fold WbuC family metalloprotein
VCLRGHLREIFYNDEGEVTEQIDITPSSDCMAMNVPIDQWHTVEVLESGTVILEFKDEAYAPLSSEDILTLK